MSEKTTGADHGAIQPELYADLNELARVIDKYFNGPAPTLTGGRQVGFFLTAFLFNEPSRFNYISNADKIDVRAMLKEVVARIEARLSAEGNA